jgi:hydroxyacylglutathione hydrolase
MLVAPNIHMLNLPFQVPIAPGKALDRFVNIYLIEGKELALIDSGVAGSEAKIFDYVRSIGRDPKEISTLVLTHSHPDHLGAAKAVKAATGCKVLAHPAERGWIQDTNRQKAERPVPGFDALVAGPVKLDVFLEDGHSIEIGGKQCMVIHTPGHSPGSISLRFPEEKVVIAGDAVPLTNDIPIYDDALAELRSIKRLHGLKPVDVLLSAWDEPRRGDEVKRVLDDAANLVRAIHRAVVESGAEQATPELAAAVMEKVGLRAEMVNPLVIRTVASHVRYREEKEAFAEEKKRRGSSA